MSSLPKYRPDGPVIDAFFRSTGEMDVTQGPIGSGSSSACCHRIYRTALQQAPAIDGVRRTRFLVVRNTFKELSETTVKTWLHWFPENVFGDLARTPPPTHRINHPHPDRRTQVDLEVIFLALDQEDDIKKLASLEVTGIWFNELQFIEKEIFDEGDSRTGRYPPMVLGGPTWSGVFADMNAPKEGHFVPYMRGDVPLPEDWDDGKRNEYLADEPRVGRAVGGGKVISVGTMRFFVQPPALSEVKDEKGKVVGYEPNPEAENQRWLKKGFYDRLWRGKDKSWVDERLMNRVGLYREGLPVYPQFVPEFHISSKPLEAVDGFPLTIGLDFGRQPAAIIWQQIRGRWYALSEVIGQNESAITFAPKVKRHLFEKYPGHVREERTAEGNPKLLGAIFWGDPSGKNKGQAEDRTPMSIFGSLGMPVLAAPGNNRQELRKSAMTSLLNRVVDGQPALLISPRCTTFKTGMNGGFHYARIQGSAGRHHDEPSKNLYSHVCEAAEYAILGGGEGTAVISSGQMPAPHAIPRQRFRLGRRA